MIIIFFLYILPLTIGEKQCCLMKRVLNGPLEGVYNLKGETQGNEDCMDDCIYTRDGEDYCFSNVSTFPVECSDKEFKRCKTVGGKPDDKEPKKAEFFEVRRYTQKQEKSDILVQEMEIEEHGLYSFTQVTTYDPALKLLTITVPPHGYNENKIEGSTTHLLQTGTDEIFDKEICIFGGESHITNVSIDVKPIVDVLRTGKKTENLQNSKLKNNHFDTIVFHSERADPSSLSDHEKMLTKEKDVFHIRKINISETTRKLISLGAKHFTNLTANNQIQNRKNKNNQTEWTEDCTGDLEKAYLDNDPVRTCFYILQIGTEEYNVTNHKITLHSRSVSCCQTLSKFASPASCHCEYLHRHTKPKSTDREFQKCVQYIYENKLEDCCLQIKKDNIDYHRADKLTGIGDYNCDEDDCLYTYTDKTDKKRKFKCFKESDKVNTYKDCKLPKH